MSNKFNGFTVPTNMNPTQPNIENPQQVEQSPLSQSEVGENLTGTNSTTRVNTSEIIEDQGKVGSRPSSSSKAINETRTVENTQPVLNNKAIKSELSKMAILQRQKLAGEVPSSGYGTETLPFAA